MERGLARYAKAKTAEPKDDDEVDPKIDYRHVESKKSQLYHRTPEVMLTAIDPEDETLPFNQLLPLRQKFLNYELGPKRANAKRAVHKTLVETLAASGWMITVVGYEDAKLPVPPDPMTGMPPIDGNGMPVTEVTIWSRRFISDISAKRLVIPDNFLDSSNFDAAPWLAYKGCMPVAQAKRLKWNIPDGFSGSNIDKEISYKHTDQNPSPVEAELSYTIIWYYAAHCDYAVFNPELMRQLVLVDGLEQAALHIDSPYQDLDPQGQLTDDSMIGNPIHVGCLRDLPDSAHVPADLIVVEPLSMELKKFRTSLVRGRRQRRPVVVMSQSLGPDVINKITRNEGPVPVPDEYIDPGGGQRAIGVAQTGTEPRDNFTAQDYLERDYEQAVGMSANQGGQFSKRKVTATEVRNVQGNSAARVETEKDRVREYEVGLYRKFDVIVQRTATPQELAKVLGQKGAMLWEQWRMLPGKYAYDILPDAGRYIDAERARAEWLQKYELLRKDPRVNEDELLAEGARLWNRDPMQFLKPPSDKTLEPPKVSTSVNLIDMNDPVAGRTALDLFANAGVKLSPDTIQMIAATHGAAVLAGAQPGQPVGANAKAEHGGPAPRSERLLKHQEERTGAVQGVGVQ